MLGIIWSTIVGSRIGRLVAGALGVLAGILLVYKAGQRDQKKNQKIKDLEDYKETMDDIQDVDINTTRDDALERLRKSGKLRD